MTCPPGLTPLSNTRPTQPIKKHKPRDIKLNTVLSDYRGKLGEIIDNLDILKLNSVGWEDVRNYPSLKIAVAAINPHQRTLLISSRVNVTKDLTIPPEISLWFLQGGSLNISTGKTVTINQQPEAGFYQIFEGAGTVVLNGQVKLAWFGGAGDSNYVTASYVTDNLIPFNKAITAVVAGSEILLSSGDYYISGAVVVSKGIKFTGIGTVNIVGDHNGIFFDFDGSLSGTGYVGWQSGTRGDRLIFELDNIGFSEGTPYNSSATAIRIRNSYGGVFKPGVIRNFGKAIQFAATDGKACYYNTIYLKRIHNCRYGIYCDVRGQTGAYVNANRILNGHINYANVWPNGTDCAAFYIKGDANAQSGSWFVNGVGIEIPADVDYQFFDLEYVARSLFEMGHMEGGLTTKITLTDSHTNNNIFILPYSFLDHSEITGLDFHNTWISRSIMKRFWSLQDVDNDWGETTTVASNVNHMFRFLDSSGNILYGLQLANNIPVEIFKGLDYGKQVYNEVADIPGGVVDKSWHLRSYPKVGKYMNMFKEDVGHTWVYAGGVILGWQTSTSATPDVEGIAQLQMTNTGALTVTNFTDGADGQHLVVSSLNGATTLQHGANIKNNTGADIILAAGEVVEYYHSGGAWVQPK